MRQIGLNVHDFINDDDGATMVEYGIMLVLIAAVCVGIITTLGPQVQAGFNSASAGL
ncbi:MAG TPA: Flp family type IVb pilin [Gemmatimonadaceae bacterium]|nr:Flp family type IVb pilin [Gemmatimonadaceae bacterium]